MPNVKFPELHNKSWLRYRHEVDKMTLREIADEVGCSHAAVCIAMRNAGIKVQQMRKEYGSNAPRPKKNIDTLHNEKWLRVKYEDERLSTGDIAKICNCSVPSIIWALNKFSITVRDSSEAKKGRPNKSNWTDKHRSNMSIKQVEAWKKRGAALDLLGRKTVTQLEMIIAYGGRCVCCNETEIRFLTLDHIEGGGNKHRKEIGGTGKLLQELKRLGWPKDKFRLLCMNCNIATKFGRTCPHELNRIEERVVEIYGEQFRRLTKDILNHVDKLKAKKELEESFDFYQYCNQMCQMLPPDELYP